jgi:hypothetical protein
MNKDCGWAVGDFCKCEYGGTGSGIIYKVANINAEAVALWLDLEPVVGILTEITHINKRTIAATWCKRITIEELANFHNKLGLFILEQIKP